LRQGVEAAAISTVPHPVLGSFGKLSMAANETQNKKLAVVTGVSSGIGLERAKQFAKNGLT
jgi:hypothetical protein